MDKVYLIGEVGPNHNGSVETALTMIEKMAEAGVDCVKFQMTDPYLLYSDDSFKASYQKKNDKAKGVREMSLSYQLKREAHIQLIHHQNFLDARKQSAGLRHLYGDFYQLDECQILRIVTKP
jgi:sialic acid synthase SpsE